MKFGGIDEFVMSKFGYSGYIKHISNEGSAQMSIPSFGNHPRSSIYQLILSEMLDTCEFLNITDSYVHELFQEESIDSDKPISSMEFCHYLTTT